MIDYRDYMLTRVVDPPEWPISLDEAKAHARIEVDDDDDLIEGFIRAATDYAEWRTQRALITQEWEWRLTCFPPNGGSIHIPKPPLQELLGFSYVNSSGVETEVDTDVFTIIAPAGPQAGRAVVALNFSKSWPTNRLQPLGVVIRFRAGYGTLDRSAEFVPDLLKQAMLTHVAEMYENRESTVLTGAILQQVPFSVENLLWPFVVDKLGI